MKHSYLFWVGFGMVAYDFSGHFLRLLCSLYGIEDLWWHYSPKLYPILDNAIIYDFFWSLFFATALFLLFYGKPRPTKEERT